MFLNIDMNQKMSDSIYFCPKDDFNALDAIYLLQLYAYFKEGLETELQFKNNLKRNKLERHFIFEDINKC